MSSVVTSIRPLGEEHIRMFRRTTGSAQAETPRVSIPEESAVKASEKFLARVEAALKDFAGGGAEIADTRGQGWHGDQLSESREKAKDKVLRDTEPFVVRIDVARDWKDEKYNPVQRTRESITKILARHRLRSVSMRLELMYSDEEYCYACIVSDESVSPEAVWQKIRVP